MSIDEKTSHQSECFYETRKCPLAKWSHVNCPWNGLLSDMKEHVLNDHAPFELIPAPTFNDLLEYFTLREPEGKGEAY